MCRWGSPRCVCRSTIKAGVTYSAVGARKDRWAGIFPVVCTPFTESGALDLDAQRAVVRFALSCGVHGLVCFGLGGEVNKLIPEERRRLTDLIVEEVDGRVPVLVGSGAEAVHTAIELARYAERAGADGVVIPPPVTANVAADELEDYFTAIAGAVDLPVMIQDAPAYLTVALSPALVRRVAERAPNVAYVKLECGPDETARWLEALGPGIQAFTGDAGIHLLSTLRAGAVGNVPAVEIADVLVAAYEAEARGDPAVAAALFQRVLPYLVFALQGIDHLNVCTKEMLVRRGVLARGGLRAPAPRPAPLLPELIDRHAADLELAAAPVASP
jgi:dihydrodipicolinate synthase/N-acetylneuraminate lyase